MATCSLCGDVYLTEQGHRCQASGSGNRAPVLTKTVTVIEELAFLRGALDFIQSLAEEELPFAPVGTGHECALRHIERRAREALDAPRDINYCARYSCREVNGMAWDRPPPPDVLVDALQDNVHKDLGEVRAAKSHRASDPMPAGHDALPKITPAIANEHGGRTALIELDDDGKRQWTQAAVDFVCMLKAYAEQIATPPVAGGLIRTVPSNEGAGPAAVGAAHEPKTYCAHAWDVIKGSLSSSGEWYMDRCLHCGETRERQISHL